MMVVWPHDVSDDQIDEDLLLCSTCLAIPIGWLLYNKLQSLYSATRMTLVPSKIVMDILYRHLQKQQRETSFLLRDMVL